MNLYEAMFVRKSVRDYQMEAFDDKTLSQITAFLSQLKPYRNSIEYKITIIDNTNEDDKIKGMFHIKAPYYLVITSELKQDYLINAGYLLHQMALYLTARDIGCCYQGSVRLKEDVRAELPYEYVIALAFGKSNKSIYRPSTKAKRLSEDRLAVYKEEVDENVKIIMKAAILSPSALNNQPWRFVVYHNRIHLFCKKSKLFHNVISDNKLIDMGVVLANITQAADELWLESSFVKSEVFSNKELKNTEYITTIMLSDKMF